MIISNKIIEKLEGDAFSLSNLEKIADILKIEFPRKQNEQCKQIRGRK